MSKFSDLTQDDVDVLKTHMAAIRIISGVVGEHLELAKNTKLGLAQMLASNKIADALNDVTMAEVDRIAEVIGLDLDRNTDSLRQVMDYLTDGNRRQSAAR